VGREFEQDFPLDQRFADKAEFEMLEISEAAVNKLGRGRRSRAAQVTLFDKHNREAASLCIAGDAAPVYTPANDGEIMDAILQAWTSHVPSLRCSQNTDAPSGGKINEEKRKSIENALLKLH
jgi:hypothetical protein